MNLIPKIFTILITAASSGGLLAAPSTNTIPMWQGSWNADSENDIDGSSLEIENVLANEFKFTVTTTLGANVGEIEGTATFNGKPNSAIGTPDPKSKCQVTFILSQRKGAEPPKLVLTTTDQCSEFAGEGVSFDGEYFKQGEKPSFKTSFSCVKAKDPIDLAICQSELLAKADLAIGDLYAKQTKTMKANPLADLKGGQKAWIKERNNSCKSKLTDNHCLERYYALRLSQLRQIASGVNPTPTPRLRFQDIERATEGESAEALTEDPLFKLILSYTLGTDLYNIFVAHNIYDSEGSKPMKDVKEVSRTGSMKGMLDETATCLTRNDDLWIGFQELQKKSFVPQVYGPKDLKAPLPDKIKDWIATQKALSKSTPVMHHTFD